MSTKASIAPRELVGTEIGGGVGTKTNFASPKVTQIITSKEWVLPPRPKPGRKPSVDTPASKRKAQNRAAQRAFRERRATRVQELEAKLVDVERENEIKEMGLINTLNKLKIENQFLLKSLNQLKKENQTLKNLANVSQSSSNPSPLHGASPSSYISPAPSDSFRSPPDNSYSPRNTSLFNTNPKPPLLNSPPLSNDSNFDCGVCTKEECLCEEVGLKDPRHSLSISNLTNNNTNHHQEQQKQQQEAEKKLKQQLDSFKPIKPVSLKRKNNDKDNNNDEYFTDFTNKFKSKPMPDLKKLKREPIDKSSVEDCGFCTDDSNCVCLAAANEAAKLSQTMQSNIDESESTLPPLYNYNVRKVSLPVLHPGPSVRVSALTNYGDITPGAAPRVDSPLRPPSTTLASTIEENSNDDGGCTGNPGTCRQCQSDPMSTLFCTTVANKEKEEEVGQVQNTKPTPMPVLETSSMYIPCSDAYKTLSRHKKFNTVDFSTVVGKLTTRGMQVEVQSVANVLRELDRNFSK